MNLDLALAPVAEAIERLQLAWQVGGSIASSFHGMPRSTIDVDIVVALERHHVAPLCRALANSFYAPIELLEDAVARRSCANLLHHATGYKVDLFVAKDSEYDRLALSRFVLRALRPGGRTYRVATAEDIVIRKLSWFRAGDEVSERQWNDIVGVLRLQRDHLDLAYLDRWAKDQRVEDLLERARRCAAAP